MNLYIGVDLGTSSMKLLLVDAKGQIQNTVTKDYPLEFPHPGWSQQHPAHWEKPSCPPPRSSTTRRLSTASSVPTLWAAKLRLKFRRFKRFPPDAENTSIVKAGTVLCRRLLRENEDKKAVGLQPIRRLFCCL